ncbi:MAG TPA: peptidase MA family metallohydrolase [Polyangiaceae bacterium]
MRPLIARLLLLVASLLALASWAPPALAQQQAQTQAAEPEADTTAPRDVGVMVQPTAAKLPSLPAGFQRIDDGWLVLEFPSSVRDRATSLAADAEEFRTRIAGDLGQPVLEHALVRIARDPEQMKALAPEGAPVPEYASGVAWPLLHLAILSMQAPHTWEATDLPELSRHELMHLALTDAVGGRHVPRWFDEGLAVHESGEAWTARVQTLWQATLSKSLVPFDDLDRSFPAEGSEAGIAYAESADLVRFMMRDDDRARFGSLVQRVRAGIAFDRALGDAYDTDLRKLEYEWRLDVSHRFGLLPAVTGGTALWGLISVLAIVAFVRRRKRAKLKLEQWAREEAEMDAAEAAARERMEREKGIPGEEDDLPAHVRPGVPVIEHEGRWYTVH